MHRFFVRFLNVSDRGVTPPAAEPSALDAGDGAMTGLVQEMGEGWQRLGNEAACVDGFSVLTVDLSLDADVDVGVIGAWVRPASGPRLPLWAVLSLSILSGFGYAVLGSTTGLLSGTVATFLFAIVGTTCATWAVARRRARLRFEQERDAKCQALYARVRTALTKADGIVLLREEPDPT